jgi:hypothetical protein
MFWGMSHGAVIPASSLQIKKGNTNQTSHIDIIITFCQKKGQEEAS